ncbi:MAG: lysophospholipid acyltransferase family protein [Candidatus Omnitrophota bacterium]
MFYSIAHIIFAIISKIFFPIKVSGLENIPSQGSFIFASNHLSNLDPMILGLASGRRLNYMAKQSLFENKFFARVLNWVGAFPVKRESMDIGAVKEAIARLKAGGGLVIFPEGTRKALQKADEVLPGVGFLAVKSGAKVIPVFIKGSDVVLPPRAKALKRAAVDVVFGKSVHYSSKEPYENIASRIMEQIQEISTAV